MGLALDVRRLDKLEQSIARSSDQAGTLSYALQACQQTVVNRAFRQEVPPAVWACLPLPLLMSELTRDERTWSH